MNIYQPFAGYTNPLLLFKISRRDEKNYHFVGGDVVFIFHRYGFWADVSGFTEICGSHLDIEEEGCSVETYRPDRSGKIIVLAGIQ
jgi:hypothetical protein